MSKTKKAIMFAKMMLCSEQLKLFTKQLHEIENEKQDQIKIIKSEITKVGAEIDIIKKEVILISSYTIN